jgi:type III secretion protein S
MADHENPKPGHSMTPDILFAKLNAALVTVLIVSSPALIAAVVVGVLVGLIQALTQIQDQSLPQAVKLIVVLVILILLGPMLGQQVVNQASMALDEFPVMTR